MQALFRVERFGGLRFLIFIGEAALSCVCFAVAFQSCGLRLLFYFPKLPFAPNFFFLFFIKKNYFLKGKITFLIFGIQNWNSSVNDFKIK